MWKAAGIAVVVALGVVFAVAVTANEDDESDCDLAHVVKMHYCDLDDVALEDDQLVSGQKYLVCEECETVVEAKGKCVHCEGKVLEKVSGKNVCPACFGAVVDAHFCVKVYYECPGCDAQALKATKCAKCEKEYQKVTSRALVEYECSVCEFTTRLPGKCADEKCKAKGTKLVRNCLESGEFPHVGAGKK